MPQSSFENALNLGGKLLNMDPLAHIKESGEADFFDREAKREVDAIQNSHLLLDEDDHTAGMKKCGADPILHALDGFRDLYNKAINELQIAKEGVKEDLDYDAEKQKLAEQARSEINAVEQRTKGIETYIRLDDDYSSASGRYSRIKEEEGGREPGSFPVVFYVFGLFCIGMAEWFINYSTFRDTYVPLIAGASTFLIACIFAAASHWHGKFFKQNVRLFQRTRDYRSRINDIIWLSFATIALIAVFSYIGWMRHSFISDQMGLGAGLGNLDLLSPDSQGMDPVLAKTMQTLGLNAFVWCVGIFISYFFHDAIPEYREARNRKEKFQKQKEVIEKKLHGQIETIKEAEKQKIQALESRVKAQTSKIRELKDLNTRIEAKAKTLSQRAQSDIEASMKRYKTSLAKHLIDHDKTIVIGTTKITIDKFMAQLSSYPIENIERRIKSGIV